MHGISQTPLDMEYMERWVFQQIFCEQYDDEQNGPAFQSDRAGFNYKTRPVLAGCPEYITASFWASVSLPVKRS